MYVATIKHFNYSKQESKKIFAVYYSDTPVTLRQGQGHKTWHQLVGPKQDYNHAKFEGPPFNSVHEKSQSNFF